jgi:hypothetical protein
VVAGGGLPVGGSEREAMSKTYERLSLLMAVLTMALAVYSVPGAGRAVFLAPGFLGALWAALRLRRSGHLRLPLGGPPEQVREAPHNNELQRTRPAQAIEPRR